MKIRKSKKKVLKQIVDKAVKDVFKKITIKNGKNYVV
jgi:hypothetical protein